ncbi:MAG: hypothetical protein HQM08_30655 [Candidatus Riflebacteria bacterium]|nr:hypothetical protein [Candidatus Riflebacteria bacterium]
MTLVNNIAEAIRASATSPKEAQEELEQLLKNPTIRKLTPEDAAQLAIAVADSGEQLGCENREYCSVHSTGGPGSITTLLGPVLLASVSIPTAILSVSGGVAGAIDSLQCFPNYQVNFDASSAERILSKSGLLHIGGGLSPFARGDATLWKARGKTSTKDAYPLIAASILGKKLAVKAKKGSLDIRVGAAGNAGLTYDKAKKLASYLSAAADCLNVRLACVLTDNSVPSLNTIGRLDYAGVLIKAVNDGKTSISKPFVQDCITLAAAAAHAFDPSFKAEAWADKIEIMLTSGTAKETLKKSLRAHGASQKPLETVLELLSKRREREIQVANTVFKSEQLSNLFQIIRSKNFLMCQSCSSAFGVELAGPDGHCCVFRRKWPPVPEITDRFSERSDEFS